LLHNGGFEFEVDGKPESWSKYGGTLGLTVDAYEGARAATLASDSTSTKWIYQAAPADEGRRYVASAVGRIADGSGEVFLRLSWYTSEDGSGTTIEQSDSPPSGSAEWTRFEISSDAPPGAHSVRVRLMLRPSGPVTAAFDATSLTDLGVRPPETTTASPVPTEATTLPAGSAPSSPALAPVRHDSLGSPSVIAGMGLRLSELLSDPDETGRDSPFEWVELVNEGSDSVDLGGWQLGDAKEMDLLPALLVPPGGYVVAAGKSAPSIPGVAIARIPDGEIGAGLNNAGDTLRLVAPDGTEVDALSYGDDTSVFEPPPPAPLAGQTLGVRVPGADPSSDNWALTDRPSPGAPNTFPPSMPRATRETPKSGDGTTFPAPAAQDGGKSPSALPWVALGLASGAGMMGIGLAGKRAWPGIKQRMKRGG